LVSTASPSAGPYAHRGYVYRLSPFTRAILTAKILFIDSSVSKFGAVVPRHDRRHICMFDRLSCCCLVWFEYLNPFSLFMFSPRLCYPTRPSLFELPDTHLSSNDFTASWTSVYNQLLSLLGSPRPCRKATSMSTSMGNAHTTKSKSIHIMGTYPGLSKQNNTLTHISRYSEFQTSPRSKKLPAWFPRRPSPSQGDGVQLPYA
jgi:hypothetical protein